MVWGRRRKCNRAAWRLGKDTRPRAGVKEYGYTLPRGVVLLAYWVDATLGWCGLSCDGKTKHSAGRHFPEKLATFTCGRVLRLPICVRILLHSCLAPSPRPVETQRHRRNMLDYGPRILACHKEQKKGGHDWSQYHVVQQKETECHGGTKDRRQCFSHRTVCVHACCCFPKVVVLGTRSIGA